MSSDLPLGCSCGSVTGTVRGVTPANARRLSCLCDDCQVYAHFLGRAPEILDPYGGTDLSYATQSRFSIHSGRDSIRCVRLTDRGIWRWYAGCCRTPIAHTVPSPKVAFVGIPHPFMDNSTVSRDRALGRLAIRLQGRFATSEPPPGTHPGTPLRLFVQGYARIVWDSWTGKQTPSTFFDAGTGRPIATPVVLDQTKLERLRAAAKGAA